MKIVRRIYYRLHGLLFFIAWIPTPFLLGIVTYKKERKRILAYRFSSPAQREKMLLKDLNLLLGKAQKYKFYRELYARHGIQDFRLKTLDDLKKFPILTKEDIRNSGYSDEVRRVNKSAYWSNTGGSTGVPLSFALPWNIYAKLWAYKVQIWGEVGYRLGDTVLSFRGHSSSRLYVHQAVYNFFYVNSSLLTSDTFEDLVVLVKRKQIKYLHGYPSNLLKFTEFYIKSNHAIGIEGIFTASEFISIKDVRLLESTFGCPVISSYEQSETSLLAYRNSSVDDLYRFLPSYGYAEVRELNGKNELIGTGLLNGSMPLIRYSTGDAVLNLGAHKDCQVVGSIDGRVGEFINFGDRSISLTGLVYGNHLPIFDYCSQVQIYVEKSVLHIFCIQVVNVPKVALDKTRVLLEQSLRFEKIHIEFHFVNELLRTNGGKKKLVLNSKEFKDLCNE